MPKDIHGKPIVIVFVCDSGPLEDSDRRVSPIKSLGSLVSDVIQMRPYVSQQSLFDTTQPKGRRYYWKSEYLPNLDPEALLKASEHAKRIVSPHSAILFLPVDGALNRLPYDRSAVANRHAASALTIIASWERADDDEANIEWVRAAWRDMNTASASI